MAKAAARFNGKRTSTVTKRTSGGKAYPRAHRKFRVWLITERTVEAAGRNESICVDCANAGKLFSVRDPAGHPWEIHHLLPVASHPHRRYDQNNCVVLCKAHHRSRENG